MTEVVIAGIGQTPVGEHWDISLRELALAGDRSSPRRMPAGCSPQALFVGNMLAPQLSRQAHLGALIADFAGLTGIEALTLEAGWRFGRGGPARRLPGGRFRAWWMWPWWSAWKNSPT